MACDRVNLLPNGTKHLGMLACKKLLTKLWFYYAYPAKFIVTAVQFLY